MPDMRHKVDIFLAIQTGLLPILVKLNVWGAAPEKVKADPGWRYLQLTNSLRDIPAWFSNPVGLTAEEVQHLQDDVPGDLIEKIRAQSVVAIDSEERVQFRWEPGETFDSHHNWSEKDGALIITINTPRSELPAEVQRELLVPA